MSIQKNKYQSLVKVQHFMEKMKRAFKQSFLDPQRYKFTIGNSLCNLETKYEASGSYIHSFIAVIRGEEIEQKQEIVLEIQFFSNTPTMKSEDINMKIAIKRKSNVYTEDSDSPCDWAVETLYSEHTTAESIRRMNSLVRLVDKIYRTPFHKLDKTFFEKYFE